MRRTASFFLIWNAICVHVDSCTFPSVLEGKTWEDSDKGRPVTFSGNVMLGWNVTAFTTVMNQWECLFNQNNIIVSKSSFVFEPLFPGFTPTTYYVYICMWIVSLDSDKFIYYLLADFVSDLNTRAYKDPNDNLGPCDVCKLSLSLDPADAEVMTSTGSPSAITIPPQSGSCSGCSCLPTSSSTINTEPGHQSSSTISTDPGQQSSSTISTDSGQQSSSTISTDSVQQSSSTISTGSNQAKEPAVGFNTVFVAPVVIGISVLIAAIVSVILYKSKKRNSKTDAEKINMCTS